MVSLFARGLVKERLHRPLLVQTDHGSKFRVHGAPGWHSGWASAFGSGRDPGVMGSSPTSGSSAMSLLLPLPLPLLVFPLSLAVSVSVE